MIKHMQATEVMMMMAWSSMKAKQEMGMRVISLLLLGMDSSPFLWIGLIHAIDHGQGVGNIPLL